MFNSIFFKTTFPYLDINAVPIQDIYQNFFSALKMAAKENSIEKFSIIYPSFYQLNDLYNWKISDYDYKNHFIFLNKKLLQSKRLKFNLYTHIKLFELLNLNSISKTVIECYNNRLRIHIKSGEKNELIVDYNSITFTLSKINLSLLISSFNTTCNLQVDFSNSIINLNDYVNLFYSSQISSLNETVEIIKKIENEIQTENFLNENSIEYKLIRPFLIHFMFLEDFELFYIFSSITQNHSEKHGLGGLFLVAEKGIITNDVLIQFEEFSDIVATRISFQFLLGKVKETAQQDTFNLLWHSLVGQVGMLMKKAEELEGKYERHEPILEEEKLTKRLNQFREYFSVARCIQTPLHYVNSQKIKGIEPEEVSLSEIITKIMDYIHYDIENDHNSFSVPAKVWRLLHSKKNMLFTFKCIGNDVIVFYDAILEVIFYNLITNAVKNIVDIDVYDVSTVLPKIEISISPIENDTEHIRFSIRNARRIDDIHYENWYDDKFAHYESGKRTSGLGIYTCKSFINALAIARQINRGAYFTEIIIDFPKHLNVTV